MNHDHSSPGIACQGHSSSLRVTNLGLEVRLNTVFVSFEIFSAIKLIHLHTIVSLHSGVMHISGGLIFTV